MIGNNDKLFELTFFYRRYLKVELDNQTHSSRYHDVFAALRERLLQTPFNPSELHDLAGASSRKLKSIVGSVSTKLGTSFRGSEGINEKDGKAKSRSMWVSAFKGPRKSAYFLSSRWAHISFSTFVRMSWSPRTSS
jgi:hypothetical protein